MKCIYFLAALLMTTVSGSAQPAKKKPAVKRTKAAEPISIGLEDMSASEAKRVRERRLVLAAELRNLAASTPQDRDTAEYARRYNAANDEVEREKKRPFWKLCEDIAIPDCPNPTLRAQEEDKARLAQQEAANAARRDKFFRDAQSFREKEGQQQQRATERAKFEEERLKNEQFQSEIIQQQHDPNQTNSRFR